MGAGASTGVGAHPELAEAEGERELLGIPRARLRKLWAGFRCFVPAPESAVTLARFQEVLDAGAPQFEARLYAWMAAPTGYGQIDVGEWPRLTLSFPSFVRGCYLYCTLTRPRMLHFTVALYGGSGDGAMGREEALTLLVDMSLASSGSEEEPLVERVRWAEAGSVLPADWATGHAASVDRLVAPALAAQAKLRRLALGRWFSAARARRRARDEVHSGAAALLGTPMPGAGEVDEDGVGPGSGSQFSSVPSAGPSPAASESRGSRSEEEERGSADAGHSKVASGSGRAEDEVEEGVGEEEGHEEEEDGHEEDEDEDLESVARARVAARAAGGAESDEGSGFEGAESEDSEDAERRARLERERQSRQLRSAYFFNRETRSPPPARGGHHYSAVRAPSFRRLAGRRRGAGSLLYRMREVTQDRAAAIQRRRSAAGGAALIFDGGNGAAVAGGGGLVRLPGARRAARMPGRGLVRAAMQGQAAGGGGRGAADEDEDEDEDDGVLGPGGGALAKRRGVRMAAAHVRVAQAKELSGVGGASATGVSLTARELAAAPSAAARAGLLILDDNGHAMLERAHRLEAVVHGGGGEKEGGGEGGARRRLGDAVVRGARATQLVRAQPRMYPRDTGPSVDPLPVAARHVNYDDTGLRFGAECFRRGRTHGEAQVQEGRALSPPRRGNVPPPKGVYVPAPPSSSDEEEFRPPPGRAAPDAMRGGEDSDEENTGRVISVTERHEMKMRRRTQAVERRRARLAAEMPWRLWTLGHPLEPRSTMARGERRALRFAARRRRQVVRQRAEKAAATGQ